jgi:curli production assembly/transport component CsgG
MEQLQLWQFRLVTLNFRILLTGCQTTKDIEIYKGKAPFIEGTSTKDRLVAIPKLDGQPKITIAVYRFTDQTGQRKPSTKFSQLSTAVTQGGSMFVVKALKSVSDGDWFLVLEREGLDNLIKERQLIRSTRTEYDGEQQVGNILKPLVFAGLLIEGSVIGYDSNIQTGGQGARYLGIGISEQYRVDQVTVSLRLVSVQSGEILLATNVTKTIASHSKGGDVFTFLDMNTKALELESGVAVNEPVTYAIRTAIEFAILELIYEGKEKGYWKFKKEEEKGIHKK